MIHAGISEQQAVIEPSGSPAVFSSPTAGYSTPAQQFFTPQSAVSSSTVAQRSGGYPPVAAASFYPARNPRRDTVWGFSPYRPTPSSSPFPGQGYSHQRVASASPVPWSIQSPPSLYRAGSTGSTQGLTSFNSLVVPTDYHQQQQEEDPMDQQRRSSTAGQHVDPLFRGAHGEVAQLYLQERVSHLISQLTHHCGDPPVSVLIDMFQSTQAADSTGYAIVRDLAKAMAEVVELAQEGVFALRVEYERSELAEIALKSGTERTRRTHCFKERVEELLSNFSVVQRCLVDRNRKRLQQPPTAAGASSSTSTAAASTADASIAEAARLFEQQLEEARVEYESWVAARPVKPAGLEITEAYVSRLERATRDASDRVQRYLDKYPELAVAEQAADEAAEAVRALSAGGSQAVKAEGSGGAEKEGSKQEYLRLQQLKQAAVERLDLAYDSQGPWLVYSSHAEQEQKLADRVAALVEKVQRSSLQPTAAAATAVAGASLMGPTYVQAYYYAKHGIMMTPAMLVFFVLESALHAHFVLVDGLNQGVFEKATQGDRSLHEWVAYMESQAPNHPQLTDYQKREIFLLRLNDKPTIEAVQKAIRKDFLEPQLATLDEVMEMTVTEVNKEVQILTAMLSSNIAEQKEQQEARKRLAELRQLLGGEVSGSSSTKVADATSSSSGRGEQEESKFRSVTDCRYLSHVRSFCNAPCVVHTNSLRPHTNGHCVAQKVAINNKAAQWGHQLNKDSQLVKAPVQQQQQQQGLMTGMVATYPMPGLLTGQSSTCWQPQWRPQATGYEAGFTAAGRPDTPRVPQPGNPGGKPPGLAPLPPPAAAAAGRNPLAYGNLPMPRPPAKETRCEHCGFDRGHWPFVCGYKYPHLASPKWKGPVTQRQHQLVEEGMRLMPPGMPAGAVYREWLQQYGPNNMPRGLYEKCLAELQEAHAAMAFEEWGLPAAMALEGLPIAPDAIAYYRQQLSTGSLPVLFENKVPQLVAGPSAAAAVAEVQGQPVDQDVAAAGLQELCLALPRSFLQSDQQPVAAAGAPPGLQQQQQSENETLELTQQPVVPDGSGPEQQQQFAFSAEQLTDLYRRLRNSQQSNKAAVQIVYKVLHPEAIAPAAAIGAAATTAAGSTTAVSINSRLKVEEQLAAALLEREAFLSPLRQKVRFADELEQRQQYEAEYTRQNTTAATQEQQFADWAEELRDAMQREGVSELNPSQAAAALYRILQSSRGFKRFTLDTMVNESPETGFILLLANGRTHLLVKVCWDTGATICIVDAQTAREMGWRFYPSLISLTLADAGKGRVVGMTELAYGVFAAGTPFQTRVPVQGVVVENVGRMFQLICAKDIIHKADVQFHSQEQQLSYRAANGVRHRLPIRCWEPQPQEQAVIAQLRDLEQVWQLLPRCEELLCAGVATAVSSSSSTQPVAESSSSSSLSAAESSSSSSPAAGSSSSRAGGVDNSSVEEGAGELTGRGSSSASVDALVFFGEHNSAGDGSSISSSVSGFSSQAVSSTIKALLPYDRWSTAAPCRLHGGHGSGYSAAHSNGECRLQAGTQQHCKEAQYSRLFAATGLLWGMDDCYMAYSLGQQSWKQELQPFAGSAAVAGEEGYWQRMEDQRADELLYRGYEEYMLSRPPVQLSLRYEEGYGVKVELRVVNELVSPPTHSTGVAAALAQLPVDAAASAAAVTGIGSSKGDTAEAASPLGVAKKVAAAVNRCRPHFYFRGVAWVSKLALLLLMAIFMVIKELVEVYLVLPLSVDEWVVYNTSAYWQPWVLWWQGLLHPVPPLSPPGSPRVAARCRKKGSVPWHVGMRERLWQGKPPTNSQLRRYRRYDQAAEQREGQQHTHAAAVFATRTSCWAVLLTVMVFFLWWTVPVVATREAVHGFQAFTSNLALWEVSHLAGWRFLRSSLSC